MNSSKLIHELKKGNIPSPQVIKFVLGKSNDSQKAVILYLLFRQLHMDSQKWLKEQLEENPTAWFYLDRLFTHDPYYDCTSIIEADKKLFEILKRIGSHETIGYDLFLYAMMGILSHAADDTFIGLFLISIYLFELSHDDIYSLTIAMRDSGKIYDYRTVFKGKQVIRRYPTGALSEKIALILPSMISAASCELPIVSAFLIGKTLSFTGGTWDKLSVIDGFVFPDAGNETEEVIKKCGAAMTVAKKDLCPVDTILYQIRSVTDTVDSIPLAVSSISSKQLSCPPNLLLLDVRYGDGAFFSQKDAQILADMIKEILNREKINVIVEMTEMCQPNGSAIGNELEICEAISIMEHEQGLFDERGKAEQRELLKHFYSRMLYTLFPQKEYTEWELYTSNLLNGNCIIESFGNLLLSHNVSENTIASLLRDPLAFFGLKERGDILSVEEGTLTWINQKSIGNIVNFGVNPTQDEQEYGSEGDHNGEKKHSELHVNLLLKKRIGDHVKVGDSLCSVYSKNELTTDTLNRYKSELLKCFSIQ